MHAPQARMSKPSADADSERGTSFQFEDPHEDSKLTIIGGEALDPQYSVQQKYYDKRSVKNIPHLSHQS